MDWKGAEKEAFAPKLTPPASLKYAANNMDKPIAFWGTVLWLDEAEVQPCAQYDKGYVWRNKGETFKYMNTSPAVKHGGGVIMLWGSIQLGL